ncbi:hypothetical protein GQ44DRAFT_339126 [Phaeosphaeriaceae sp. PMI808]|nr:hypothetical protein GQ44DRAFT_339126 [Phaeosphaeriaceae sp. PMI808]
MGVEDGELTKIGVEVGVSVEVGRAKMRSILASWAGTPQFNGCQACGGCEVLASGPTLSPAALRSNSTLAMPPLNQLTLASCPAIITNFVPLSVFDCSTRTCHACTYSNDLTILPSCTFCGLKMAVKAAWSNLLARTFRATLHFRLVGKNAASCLSALQITFA